MHAFNNVSPVLSRQTRLKIVSRKAKKKQTVHDEQASYLHVALL